MLKRCLTTALLLTCSIASSQNFEIENLTIQPTANLLRYEISCKTTEPARVFVEYLNIDETEQVLHTAMAPKDTIHQIVLSGLLPESLYSATVVALNESGTTAMPSPGIFTPALPNYFPNTDSLNIDNTAFDQGWLFHSSLQSTTELIVARRNTGELVWYEELETTSTSPICRSFEITSSGNLILADCQKIEAMTLGGKSLFSIDLNEDENLNSLYLHHEILQNEVGHYVVLAASVETVDLSEIGGSISSQIINEHILEFSPGGELIWRWNALDHLQPEILPEGPGVFEPLFGDEALSWLEFNAISEQSGAYLVSSGKLGKVFRVSKSSDSLLTYGEGGDYILSQGNWFSNPLSISPADNFTLLFDAPDRILEFYIAPNIDPATVVYDKEWTLPTSLQSSTEADLLLLDENNYLIASGETNSIFTMNREDGSIDWFLRQDQDVKQLGFLANTLPKLPDFIINEFETICSNSEPIELSASPAGGYFIYDSEFIQHFDPTVAGPGQHIIRYHYGWEAVSFTVEVEECTSIVALDKNQIAVYPNPTGNHLRFSIESSGPVIVQIYDVKGRHISSLSSDQLLSVAGWPSGIYFARIQKTSVKFIVE